MIIFFAFPFLFTFFHVGLANKYKNNIFFYLLNCKQKEREENTINYILHRLECTNITASNINRK